ncbi:hypothetical protein ACU686_15575 [Yinghuangia aomiensis]
MLGALRSGAAYLPLDPEHLDARLADMLDATRKALPVRRHHVGRSPPGSPDPASG